jgi:hypothetical protein
MTHYARDVRESRFPEEEHTYKMIEGETEKLESMVRNSSCYLPA